MQIVFIINFYLGSLVAGVGVKTMLDVFFREVKLYDVFASNPACHTHICIGTHTLHLQDGIQRIIRTGVSLGYS